MMHQHVRLLDPRSWLISFLLLITSPVQAEENAVSIPDTFQACIVKAVIDAFHIDHTDPVTARTLFDSHIDFEWLGLTTYPNNWKIASREWKNEGINQYFQYIWKRLRIVTNRVQVIPSSIQSHLAEESERYGDGRYGYWEIVFTATLTNGTSITGAVLMSATCKILDIKASNIWISSTMKATFVDRALHLVQN